MCACQDHPRFVCTRCLPRHQVDLTISAGSDEPDTLQDERDREASRYTWELAQDLRGRS